MSYNIEIRLADKNGFHTPAEALKFYKRYRRDGPTIHWWNAKNLVTDDDHDNIVNYILGKARRGVGSVNYVLSNKKITLVVNADNVAWASQAGNPTTVSIECSPHLNAEGYKKLAWLINELFNPVNGRYRQKPGYWKHSDWFTTACPGTISMDIIKSSVAKWEDGRFEDAPVVVQPVVVPPNTAKNVDFMLWKDGAEYVCNKQVTIMHDMTNISKWSDRIPARLTFKKGDKINIAGSFHNVGLNRDYYITKSSFDRKSATGFSPADLDIFVPPRPTPKPPETLPVPPVEPTDEIQPINYAKENNTLLKQILSLLQSLVAKITSIYK